MRAALLIFPVLMGFNISCEREPFLHLYDYEIGNIQLSDLDLALEVLWDVKYSAALGLDYVNWKEDWHYGNDEEGQWTDWDKKNLNPVPDYTKPVAYYAYLYYTGQQTNVPHTMVEYPKENPFPTDTMSIPGFHYGYYDILVHNDLIIKESTQNIHFIESLDSIIAETGPTIYPSRYQAPRYLRSFYQPEELFTAYDAGEYIDPDHKGFDYKDGRYFKMLNMKLYPITYIYLPQIILINNRGRIHSIDGSGNLSGMARTTSLFTGVAGTDAVTVNFVMNMKYNVKIRKYHIVKSIKSGTIISDTVLRPGMVVDIIGGRLTTFGICGENNFHIDDTLGVHDYHKHYLDLNMHFNNGLDSTFSFDVTNQVRKRWIGGVITRFINVDTLKIPQRTGGSAFDAVVEDFVEEEPYEFDM